MSSLLNLFKTNKKALVPATICLSLAGASFGIGIYHDIKSLMVKSPVEKKYHETAMFAYMFGAGVLFASAGTAVAIFGLDEVEHVRKKTTAPPESEPLFI